MSTNLVDYFVERHQVGRRPIFDAVQHLKLLYEVFVVGGTVEMYCRQAGICEKTFRNWKRKYRSFRTAYSEAKMLAKAYYHEIGLNPPNNFNFSVWLHAMKVRFKEPHERLVVVKMPNNKEITNDEHLVQAYYLLLQDSLKGKITPKEFTEMASGLKDGLVINESSVVRKELNELKAMFKGNTSI